jgi:nucleotide sugar dehydrogenase
LIGYGKPALTPGSSSLHDPDLLVIGLGHVGLPLAAEAARCGLTVVGYDPDHAIVSGLNAGRSHIADVPGDELQAMLAGRFLATATEDATGRPAVIVICAPTPLTADNGPDLGAVRSAAALAARRLRPGALVVLESTTYPGTTEEVVRPLLEKESGLTAGLDFSLAFSPERIDPGNPAFGIRNTPKVVGGVTPSCAEAAAVFYGTICDHVVRAASARGGDGQAAGEHLPAREHRPGQRDGNLLPRARRGPVGRDQVRGHQAVRLPALLPRP